jgi:Kef-type K+ transport system membrane component KefB
LIRSSLFSAALHCWQPSACTSRQPMLVAYILLGCVIGPYGLGLIDDDQHLGEIAEIGIMFLLFLVGLDLQPSKLRNMLGESMLTALGTSIAFLALGTSTMYAFGFGLAESIAVGLGPYLLEHHIGPQTTPNYGTTSSSHWGNCNQFALDSRHAGHHCHRRG